MRSTRALLAGFLMLPALVLAEEWTGVEPIAPRLTLGYGEDEDDFRVGMLSGNLPMANHNRFRFTVERGELSDGRDTELYRVGLSSDPLADQVVSADVIVQGTEKRSRLREVQFESLWYDGPWDFSLRARGGQVRVDTNDDNGSRERGQRLGLGAGLGYVTGPFFFSLDGIEYFYRWNDQEPESSNQLPFFSGSSSNNRRQPIVDDRQLTARATFFAGPWDFQVGAQRIVAIDGERQDLMLYGAGYETAGGLQLGVDLEVPTDDEPIFGQVTLGIRL